MRCWSLNEGLLSEEKQWARRRPYLATVIAPQRRASLGREAMNNRPTPPVNDSASTKGFSRKRSNFPAGSAYWDHVEMPQRRASLGREAMGRRELCGVAGPGASTKGFSRKRSNLAVLATAIGVVLQPQRRASLGREAITTGGTDSALQT